MTLKMYANSKEPGGTQRDREAKGLPESLTGVNSMAPGDTQRKWANNSPKSVFAHLFGLYRIIHAHLFISTEYLCQAPGSMIYFVLKGANGRGSG